MIPRTCRQVTSQPRPPSVYKSHPLPSIHSSIFSIQRQGSMSLTHTHQFGPDRDADPSPQPSDRTSTRPTSIDTGTPPINPRRFHKRTPTGLSKRRPSISAAEDAALESIDNLWKSLSLTPYWSTSPEFQKDFIRHVETSLAHSALLGVRGVDIWTAYFATSLALRDRLILHWNMTQQAHTRVDRKRVYYLSLEFLLGRTLSSTLTNLHLQPLLAKALADLGLDLAQLGDAEPDAALGNGGLGRLAACFLDSLATLNYPAWGYGVRYDYGIFRQEIGGEGEQVEVAEGWLSSGYPWEVRREDVRVLVRFGGWVEDVGAEEREREEMSKEARRWVGGEEVWAVAYDVPIPGYVPTEGNHPNHTTNNLRLWSAKPAIEFDFQRFNRGEYEESVRDAQRAGTISAVLYPNDNVYVGKELRLKQQYFWIRASLYDILRRFRKTERGWGELPRQVAIQLNDTHPTLAVPELLRVLVDEEGMAYEEAWPLVVGVFAHTNHTVLPEALERWEVGMIQRLLPRHMELIYLINWHFLSDVSKKFPDDRELLGRVSIIEEGHVKMVRMAHLAVVGSHKVNGVAELHSDLITKTIFKDFVRVFGRDRFLNVTNGITPRRWLYQANPGLTALIQSKIGTKFLTDLTALHELGQYATDKEFGKRWREVKYRNKQRLAAHVLEVSGIALNCDALWDVQVKRIHEYKRQTLNIYGVVSRWLRLRAMSPAEKRNVVPRVCIFGGKAAPGYRMAKLIIKFINAVARVVNADPEVEGLLQVVFVPDYNVSKAELIIPANDISEHISTAGTEASGTSNMKFVLNGGLIIGTVDGANVEIVREIGEENIFLFGNLAEDVEDLRFAHRYGKVRMDPGLEVVVREIEKGTFGDGREFGELVEAVRGDRDHYLISDDFGACSSLPCLHLAMMANDVMTRFACPGFGG
ncbi:phosphorylase-domain-containing protein [Saitoella complicata NRRL Y-17804]|uniref:phosphorylase-domain-containing protein n=1 Tax=Saitoella complicata (strain BCRC 22490 / CBS 7301 / JCM 7358 / NBRC 10748 / NRRL Y-17804) TaxID=698492 RepID=UPI000866FC88|nr:phosphorylase-domain-containing protein [Saitoella complicata NRRL Y-17804]ODQ50343.1 phosphorylase-domain-containing protein [Saitoella complicata NRRL Y-17804]